MTKIPQRYAVSGSSEKGGFGEVHFCVDTHLDRNVAIKFITDKTQAKKSVDELKALLLLRSKHIVQVYDIVNCEDESVGIVQEFIDGENLWNSKYPKENDEQFLKTLWQIACGISDIHSAKVIHRDIKPNNMKLDKEGLVKIFDFGLAKNISDEIKTKGFKGTFGFAAPELLTDETAYFSPAVDTYAFGACIFILSGDNIPESLRQIPPVPLPPGFFQNLSRKIPDGLTALLESCLATDAALRPTMSRVRDEITKYLLKDKHQALAVIGNKPSYLNAQSRKVNLEFENIGKVEITYDGLQFQVTAVSGETFINNNSVYVGHIIPSSCVLTFGAAGRPNNQRAFVTFDISNPEVIL